LHSSLQFCEEELLGALVFYFHFCLQEYRIGLTIGPKRQNETATKFDLAHFLDFFRKI